MLLGMQRLYPLNINCGLAAPDVRFLMSFAEFSKIMELTKFKEAHHLRTRNSPPPEVTHGQ
jgi:hypothetical protein